MTSAGAGVIAIDGPAGSGKSTIARLLAMRLGLRYIDTGAMYRAVTLTAIRRGIPFDDDEALTDLAGQLQIEWLPRDAGGGIIANGERLGQELRTPEVSDGASRVSAVPGVRTALLEHQRQQGRSLGCVMEGRDIGTVVFPDARLKIFLTASPEERARRRQRELEAAGIEARSTDVHHQVAERDRRDSERATAPLKPAADAIHIVTDGFSPEDLVERIADLYRERGGR